MVKTHLNVQKHISTVELQCWFLAVVCSFCNRASLLTWPLAGRGPQICPHSRHYYEKICLC